MDAKFLRENAIFWSLLGFCYDPPIPDETGSPRLFDHNFARYTRYHDDFADAGVDVHTFILHSGWVGVDQYDYSVCDKVLDGIFASGKIKYAFPRVKLNVPVDWCAEYPEEVWVYDKGPRKAEDIRALEALRSLPQKELVKIGIPYMDEMAPEWYLLAHQADLAWRNAEQAFETYKILKESYSALIETTLRQRREMRDRIERKYKSN